MNSKRLSWNEYFIKLANLVSTRATCDRLHVGCVIVKDNRVLSTGYNGSPSNMPHCDDEGHLIIDNHCVRTTHAEANAIAQAAKYGISLDNSICYITHSPCYTCAKLLYSSGIRTVYIQNSYGSDFLQKELFKEGWIYYVSETKREV